MALNGFSVLAWVKPDSPLVLNVSEDARHRIEQQLLLDFNCLLGCRWNMDMHLTTVDDIRYSFGINPRITASERTISNAIGTLTNHVAFLRGTANHTAEDLARFKICKEKWSVPDEVSTTTYGWEAVGPQETSPSNKRRRF